MKYMLDTNICIFIIKHKPESVIMKFLSHSPEDLCISAITYAELVHGVEKSQAVAKNRLALSLMLSTIAVLDFDADAAVGTEESVLHLKRKAHRSDRLICLLQVMHSQKG